MMMMMRKPLVCADGAHRHRRAVAATAARIAPPGASARRGRCVRGAERDEGASDGGHGVVRASHALRRGVALSRGASRLNSSCVCMGYNTRQMSESIIYMLYSDVAAMDAREPRRRARERASRSRVRARDDRLDRLERLRSHGVRLHGVIDGFRVHSRGGSRRSRRCDGAHHRGVREAIERQRHRRRR